MNTEILIGILVLLLGTAVGAALAWLLLKTKAGAVTAAELATLKERLAGKQGELQKLQGTLEAETLVRSQLVEDLRAETDQRSSAEQRASRVGSLESQLADLQDENAFKNNFAPCTLSFALTFQGISQIDGVLADPSIQVAKSFDFILQ